MDDTDNPLAGAGLDPRTEQVYRALVTAGRATPERIAGAIGADVAEVRDGLATLSTRELVVSDDPASGHFRPHRPDVGLGRLLLQQQELLERTRSAITELVEDYDGGVRRRDADRLVEIISGAGNIRGALRTVQRDARDEVLWLCRAGHIVMASGSNDDEYRALARGVRYRVLYEQAMLESPGVIQNVSDGVRAGEIARAVPALPIRLAIVDQRVAICPLVDNTDPATEPTAAVVRSSTLLTALVSLFENYWSTASPLQVAADGRVQLDTELDADQAQLLSLLVAGVADKAIATRMGISLRTVHRRVADLMEYAGAQTRTQLAWQAARRGWLVGQD